MDVFIFDRSGFYYLEIYLKLEFSVITASMKEEI